MERGRERSRLSAFWDGDAPPESAAAVLLVSGRSSGGRTMEGVTTVDVPGVGVPVDDDRSGGDGWRDKGLAREKERLGTRTYHRDVHVTLRHLE